MLPIYLLRPNLTQSDRARAAADRELAVVRALTAVLDDALARADIETANDVTEQIAEHLRRLGRPSAAA